MANSLVLGPEDLSKMHHSKPFHTDCYNPDWIQIANLDSTRILFRWWVPNSISRWRSRGRWVEIPRRYIGKDVQQESDGSASAIRNARGMIFVNRPEVCGWSSSTVDRPVLLLRSLPVMSPYTLFQGFSFIVVLIPSTQEYLALTRSVGRCLYEHWAASD